MLDGISGILLIVSFSFLRMTAGATHQVETAHDRHLTSVGIVAWSRVSSCIRVLLLHLVRVKEGILLGAATLLIASASGCMGSLNQRRHFVLFIVQILEHLASGHLGPLSGLSQDLRSTLDQLLDRPAVHLDVLALALLSRCDDWMRHVDEGIGSLGVGILGWLA